MWQYNYGSDELYHWGIKGQKWGVRRYQNRDGTLTAAGKIRYSDGNSESRNVSPDYVRAHTSKSISEMSDQELRDRINRLNMETNYKRLTSSPSNLKKAMTTAASVAAAMGTVASLYNQSQTMMKIGKEVYKKFSNAKLG